MAIFYHTINKSLQLLMKRSGFVTRKTHTFYCPAIPANSTVMDLGANVGEFSKAITDEFHCHCHAVEAVPHLYSQIPESSLLKKHNVAITDRNAPVTLHLSENRESNSIGGAVAGSFGIKGTMICDGLTLESLLNQLQIQFIDLLKIDIEGAEEQLFNSTSDATLRSIGQITIEFHDFIEGSISPRTVQEITRRLNRLGFSLFPFSYIYPGLTHCDLLFVNTQRVRLPWKTSINSKFIKLLLHLERTKQRCFGK